MPDYKELYYKLFRANEKAIRELIRAQQECEELILSQDEDEQSQPGGIVQFCANTQDK